MNSSKSVYIISDTHWFHDMITKKYFRPKNFMDLTIKYWNNVVRDHDIVFHLGDVIFYNYNILKDILDGLPGDKILIRGNHDRKSNNWYMNNGFTFSCELFSYKNILFTHKRSKFESNNFLLNIHGHTHTNIYDYIQNFKRTDVLYHRLYSLEFENYRIVNLQQFVRKTELASYYYDKLKEFKQTNGKKS